MEQNDKIRLLLDMHEHPENYSDEQLASMLEDEQMATLWQQLATAKRALTDAPEPDVDAEWQRFEQEHYSPARNRRWLKVAAMFIGVLMLSAFTYAAIHAIRHSFNDKAKEPTETVAPDSQTESTVGPRLGVADTATVVVAEPVVFDNLPLDQMLEQVAPHYGMQVEFRNEEARTLRFYFVWQPDEDLDATLERLNMFESVNISKEGNTIVVE
jgi:ferric-dicitrate binding protein FerR (iron transport regulator)